MTTRAIARRVIDTGACRIGRLVAEQGLAVEDSGVPLNLMLARSIQAVVDGGPDACRVRARRAPSVNRRPRRFAGD
ncbi:hypothetical protein CDEF62S_00907 [Castellaniella defragrans]